MEKLFKIGIISSFVILINIFNITGIGLITSFLIPTILYFTKKEWLKHSLLLTPLVLLSISLLSRDYKMLVYWSVIVYTIRTLIKDSNNTKYWVFFLLISIFLFFINKFYSFYSFIFLLLSLPVWPIEYGITKKKWQTLIQIIFILTVFITFFFSLNIESLNKQRKSAYLIKGVWALPYPEYKLSDLRNETGYSYSEFRKLINADTIRNLSKLNNYNELWIVTPTQPFTNDEIKTIKDWVKSGGHLIVVGDHTDLYGHGRCLNQLLSDFNCNVDYSVAFKKDNSQHFKTTFGKNANIKTGTTFEGSLTFPIISSMLWIEPAYYANDNFFGPVTASGNDEYTLRNICGVKSVGLGQVTLLGDSTFFANFSVYQPHSWEFLSFLVQINPFARLLLLLPLLYIIVLLLLYFNQKKYLFLFSIFCILPFGFYFYDNSLNWGEKPQIWSGNPNFVFEDGCPYANISTAYSLASLSGNKPKWINNVSNSLTDVIWVDSVPPPNKNWRWIEVEDKHSYPLHQKTPFLSLYNNLSTPNIRHWVEINNYKHIIVMDIFNDIVMNNWWYNNGISKSRKLRINAWVSWLQKKQMPIPLKYNASLFSTKLYNTVLRIEKKDPIYLKLPKPFANTGEIYLGEGVSCNILITKKGNKALIGFGQLTEQWGAPSIWIVDYLE